MIVSIERRDYLKFFKTWLSHPMRTAAIAPSSNSLARLMTADILPSGAPVLELGPGTGVFTKALVQLGHLEENLTLIEFEPAFSELLRARYPRARVVSMDASKIFRADLFPAADVAAVVSGLPLLTMPPRKVMSILAGSFEYTQPGGAFYQFTYGFRCPVPRPILDRLHLKATFIGRTICNIPPAAVYKITKRKPAATGSARRPWPDPVRASLSAVSLA